MPLIDSILTELEQEAQTTQKLLERVPEDKLSWKPHPKSFSLGQLALHIAQTPKALATMALLDSVEAPGARQEEAKSRGDLLAAARQELAAAKEALAGLDDGKLMAPWSVLREGKPILTFPRLALLRTFLLNHYYHHRGQLSVYLRLLDVPVPSIYGPSADDNPFA